MDNLFIKALRGGALLSVFAMQCWSQCASIYQDSSTDGTSVHAWTVLTDNFTNAGSGCAPVSWQNFVHTYRTSITLTSPTGRTNSNSNSGQQSANSGVGSNSTETILDIGDDLGNYTYTIADTISCTVAGNFFNGNTGGNSFVDTPPQHDYPSNPLPQMCRITSFFDASRYGHAHHAEDLVYDDGQGGKTLPAYGTEVKAMEAGRVTIAISTNGPAATAYPACQGAPGNYVKITTTDGYSTIYFHMTPTVATNDNVTAGQVIGHLDNSGCQTAAHLHLARKNAAGIAVNFTIPCINPRPTMRFDDADGLVADGVPDNN